MEAATTARIALAAVVIFGLSVLAGALLARSTADPVEASVAGTQVATTTSSSTSTTVAPELVGSSPSQANSTSTTTIPPIQGFADLFEQARGAIANVDVVRCEAGAQGTAFLVDADTAFTAAHVVDGAAEIALDFGDQRVEATVIGRNIDRDVAVLRLATPIENAVTLPVAQGEPRVGEEVAAIGHPQGLPVAMTVGRVTSMNAEFDFSGTGAERVQNLIQADFVVATGTSGGPLINQRGEVVGVAIQRDVIAEGLFFAANLSDVRAELFDLALNPEPVRPAFCVGSIELDDIDELAAELVASEVDTLDVPDLQRTFAVYTQTLNSGRASAAFDILGPSITTTTTREAWAEEQSTSNLWDWRIRQISPTPVGLAVRSTFTSTQEAQFGFDNESTCTRWDVTHNMVRGQFQGRDFWLIDASRVSNDDGPVDCEDWEPTVVQRQRLVINPGDEPLVRQDLLSAGSVDQWLYTVNLAEGVESATYELVVETLTDSFSPTLAAIDQNGNQIAVNDDPAPADPRVQVQLVVDATARGRIEVGDLGQRDGGAYRLTITQVAVVEAAPDSETNPDVDPGNGPPGDGEGAEFTG